MSMKFWVNALSLSRFGFALLQIQLLVDQRWILASLLFWLVIISDFVDGYLARKYHCTSALGGFFDHSADAFFVSSGLLVLSLIGPIPLILPILIVLAFLQYMFDSKVLSGHQLRTSMIGRSNGIAYFILLGCTLMGPNILPMIFTENVLFGLSIVLILTTLISMIDRLFATLKIVKSND